MYIALPLAALGFMCVIMLIGHAVSRRPAAVSAAKAEAIRSLLPLLDCGACGHRSCRAFADAVLLGTASPHGCFPGGPKAAHAIGDIIGVAVEMPEPLMAVVHCKGGAAEAVERTCYDGIADCLAADLSGNGPRECRYGCLGLGTCVKACPFGAIRINRNGVAVVDHEKCTGCAVCTASCPRHLIDMVPTLHKVFLACSSHDDGSSVRGYCSVGCTACGLCVLATASGAIAMEDNLPVLDYKAGEIFIAAAARCPSKCFVDLMKARPKANIDIKCDGCGDCVSVCPVNAITGANGERHVVDKNLCIGCGQCVGVCHVRAISMWGGLGYIRKESLRKSWS